MKTKKKLKIKTKTEKLLLNFKLQFAVNVNVLAEENKTLLFQIFKSLFHKNIKINKNCV